MVSSFVSMCGRCHYCQIGHPKFCLPSLKALYTLGPSGKGSSALFSRDAALGVKGCGGGI